MSLEDETQQPAVAGSSQAPAAIGLHSSTNAGIMATLQQQYATSTATHSTLTAPPSSDPPLVAATSDLTQEPESEDSLRWESHPQLPPLASGGSPQHTVLAQIEEETQPPQPPSASAKSTEDMEFLVSQTPEYANDSMKEDDDDPTESEMSDVEEDGDEPDSVSVSTPPNSHPEASNPTSAALPQQPPSAPEQVMRPISNTSVPAPPMSSPTRALITPSRHATQITTPTKKKNPASPSTPLKLIPDLSFKSPIAATPSSKRPPPRKVQSDSHAVRPRSPSPGESSDFARDMRPAPRKLSAQEQIDALFSGDGGNKSPESDKSSPTRRRRPVWKTTSGPDLGSRPSPAKVQPSFEPTLLNDGEQRQVSSPVAGAQTTSPRAFYSSETQVDPAADPLTSPAGRRPQPPTNGSQTLLNTVRPLGSQTQLNSGSIPPSSPQNPPAVPGRRLGHFASIPSSARAESPVLLFESIDELGDSDLRSQHEESFVATQLNTIPQAVSTPPRQLGVGTSPAAPVHFGTIDSSGSHESVPQVQANHAVPAPSDSELEPTYVDPASMKANESVGSQEGAQAPASDPPARILPSSIEPLRPVHRAVVSAPEVSTPLSPPPSDEPTKDLEPPTATPPNPMDEESEPSTLIPVVPPRRSPYKYGKRGQRIPSTRAGMPRRRLPSASPDGSPAGERHSEERHSAERHSSTPGSTRPSQAGTQSPVSDNSDSSGTTVDDPDDATFHDDGPAPASQPSPDLSTAQPSPPSSNETNAKAANRRNKVKSKSKPATRSAEQPADGPSSRASSRPTRDKRKALSTSPEFSDESSDAPEDVEDYSYRPTKAGREKAKAASRASSRPVKEMEGSDDEAASDAASEEVSSKSKRKTPSSKSSRQPPRKRSKTTTAATIKPTRSRSAGRSPRVATTSIADVADGSSATMRVLGHWGNTEQYYAGTVVGRSGVNYSVVFDDGHDAPMGSDRLRVLRLRPGDPVFDGSKGVYHVAEQYDGEGDITVVGPRGKPYTIKSKNLVVLGPDIALSFADRHVSRAELEKLFPMSSPRNSLSSTSKVFDGKVFVMTGAKDKKADEVRKMVHHHGGTVAANWTDLFHISKSGHTLAGHRTPFVLQFGPTIMTPKFMAALAAGVPVLGGKYIEDAVESAVNWRAYLISPGESVLLGQPASQVIDPTWGEASWDAGAAQAVRQPLAGMTVLYVYSNGSTEVKSLASFCLRAMGASVSMAAALPSDFTTQDLVLVDDRVKAVTLTSAAKKSGRLVNVPWLKACLTAGAVLPPALMKDAARG